MQYCGTAHTHVSTEQFEQVICHADHPLVVTPNTDGTASLLCQECGIILHRWIRNDDEGEE